MPSGTGSEKTVQVGSWARRRRSTMDRASGPLSSTVIRRDSTTFLSTAPGADMVATAPATMSA